MAANDDSFIWKLAAANLANSNCRRNRPRTKRSTQLHFHCDRAFFRQAINQAVILMCNKSQRNCARLIAAEATHGKETVSLAAIKQDHRRLFLRDLRHNLDSFPEPDLRGMRYSSFRRNHGVISVFCRLGWYLCWFVQQKDCALQLAFKFC